MTRIMAVLACLLAALSMTACGEGSAGPGVARRPASGSSTSAPPSPGATSTTPSSPAPPVQLATADIAGLGQVLVNGQGLTLYMFVPDRDQKVTCVGACAAVWPPLWLPPGASVITSGAVQETLVGSDSDPAGGRVVTYGGWPLYTYVDDSGAGMANGQDLNANGGLWYVIAPNGEVISTRLKRG